MKKESVDNHVIISDVHGNLEALQAVLEEVKRFEPYTLHALGDTIGGGANPRECLQIIGDKADLMLCGLTDLVVVGKYVIESSTDDFKRVVDWTRDQLTDAEREMCANLPEEYFDEDRIYSHGSPVDPDGFTPVATDAMVEKLLKVRKEDFIFTGSTHKPRITLLDKTQGTVVRTITSPLRIPLSKSFRYLINPGSVGDSHDKDYRACAVVIEDGFIQLIRVSYDRNKAYRKMRDVGLPLTHFL